MFTGIIEARVRVTAVENRDKSLVMTVARPPHFQDLKRGDSIACNGICLTLEEFNDHHLVFTLGYETLQVTGWTSQDLLDAEMNLERSLRFGDRIHGHMVSGHVDATASVLGKQWQGESLLLEFSIPASLRPYIWKKSSVAIHGVSLTVNEVGEGGFSVCLIPETLKQTQLATLEVGDSVNLEADYYMKGLLSARGVINEQRC